LKILISDKLDAAALDLLRERYRASIVEQKRVQAHLDTALEHWEVIGKTGTAEHARSQAGLAEPHVWFAGWAGPPGGAPEIVVVVIVVNGGSSSVAAAIMAKAADFYLRREYGIPVDTIQTYREHLRLGLPTPWYSSRFPATPEGPE